MKIKHEFCERVWEYGNSYRVVEAVEMLARNTLFCGYWVYFGCVAVVRLKTFQFRRIVVCRLVFRQFFAIIIFIAINVSWISLQSKHISNAFWCIISGCKHLLDAFIMGEIMSIANNLSIILAFTTTHYGYNCACQRRTTISAIALFYHSSLKTSDLLAKMYQNLHILQAIRLWFQRIMNLF